ncbi:cytochrome b5 domain-containing protein [Patescibacteria group bacterium]
MKYALLFTGLLILLSGCLPQQNSQPTTKTEQPNTTLYSMSEISQHSSESDCWLLISGRVYDVTEFIARHPGGKAILQGCGQNATILYSTRPMGSGTDHSDRAKSSLDNYYIGNLKSNEQ